MSSTNTRAGNAAHVASSSKRKSTGYEVGSSSKRVALEIFSTHPKQNELSHVSQSPALNHDAIGGLNVQSFTSLQNSGHYDTNVQSVPLDTQEDQFDRLFKSQYEKLRETCKQYLNNEYNDLVRQAEERASSICREKDMEVAHMKRKIFYLQEKLASQSEVLKNENTELDNSRRKIIELEEQLAQYNSQAEDWQKKVERAQGMLRNATVSRRRQAPCCREDEEVTAALSSVGETRW